jgi:hypothetical protein
VINVSLVQEQADVRVVCCLLELCKRVVVNNLNRTDVVDIGCSLLSGQWEDMQDGPVLRILV